MAELVRARGAQGFRPYAEARRAFHSPPRKTTSAAKCPPKQTPPPPMSKFLVLKTAPPEETGTEVVASISGSVVSERAEDQRSECLWSSAYFTTTSHAQA